MSTANFAFLLALWLSAFNLAYAIREGSGDVLPSPTACTNCTICQYPCHPLPPPPPSGYPLYGAPPPPSPPSGYPSYQSPPPPLVKGNCSTAPVDCCGAGNTPPPPYPYGYIPEGNASQNSSLAFFSTVILLLSIYVLL